MRAEADTTDVVRASLERFASARLRAFLDSGAELVLPDPKDAAVTIVMPTHQQAHLTYLALEALAAAGSRTAFELVVVDNCSTDETWGLLGRVRNARVRRNLRNAGFGAACSEGVRMASGRHVCFLNNDAFPAPGWLDALVETMEGEAGCAAVGAKLIRIDGTLQEAGSIIWEDGSTQGYGVGENPSAPQFSYRREVDYCSAACLLVRRDAFLALGGFDERYAPAYYEDADLCLALREAGYRVLYEPRAAVVHVEFGSSDRERGLGLQEQNRAKFVAKWGHLVSGRPRSGRENEVFARDRRRAPRVLVVDDQVPDPRLGAGSPRMRALIGCLVGLDYAITYVARGDYGSQSPARAELEAAGVEMIVASHDVRPILEARRGLYDLAIVSRARNAPLLESVKSLNPGVRVVYDAETLFSMRELGRRALAGTPVTQEEIARRVKEEFACADQADLILAVSPEDAGVIRRQRPDVPVAVWGDSRAVRRGTPSFEQRDDLLFIGHLATAPNADAVAVMLGEIFPPVRERLGCRLFVVGLNPPPEVLRASLDHGKSVVLTGLVDELAPVYDAARVFVAPHRFASGIPLKVVEAMTNGVPCVVSRLLADQLGAADGSELLVVDSLEDFPPAIERVYRDEALWRRVRENAYRFVEERFSPVEMQARLAEIERSWRD